MPQRSSVSIELMSRTENDGAKWVHLIPSGTFVGRDGRGPHKLNNATAVMDMSRRLAGKRLIPVDYDHAIDNGTPNGTAAPAAGWVKGLQARNDGIWGLVEWTPRAKQQIDQHEYRYISPVFNHARDGTVTAILRASLTNNPNLDQLTALASMENPTMDAIAAICKELGLPESASTDEILAKLRELTSAKTAQSHSEGYDPTKFVPIGTFERAVEMINELNTGISLNAATSHVERQIEIGRLLPWMKDWGIALCRRDKKSFDDFTQKMSKGLEPLLKEIIPGGRPSWSNTTLSQEEKDIASNIGVSADDFLKTRNARAGGQE